ncbi:hypothetical protein D9M69_459690 [compost metagenome]
MVRPPDCAVGWSGWTPAKAGMSYLMARSKTIYALNEVADMIGENLELLEEVTSNSDTIAEGELVHRKRIRDKRLD